MRPKGFAAKSFGRNFGEFSAETVSALMAVFGFWPKQSIFDRNINFRPKMPLLAKNVSNGRYNGFGEIPLLQI